MAELLAIAIGVGLVVTLLFSELFGLAAGGLVVPGYFALYLHQPSVLIITVTAAFLTYIIAKVVSQFSIVYGKRRTVLMILVGYLVRMLIDAGQLSPSLRMELITHADFTVIGYIIPGLIAIWMDRQGVVETLATLVTASVLVRLVLILVFGAELMFLFGQQP